MAAHRYWRIQVITSGTFSSIGEIQLRDSIGGANRIGSGTASANSTFGGVYVAASAVDGNTATDWSSAGADTTPNWWQYDFGSGNAFDIVQVVITATTNGDANYTPTDFTVAYSDNGTTWTTLYRFRRSAPWTSGVSQTFTLNPGSGSAHSSWRINVTSTPLNQYVEIAELALRATPGGGNLLSSGSPSAYASSVTAGGGFEPNKAYDGSNTTAWATLALSSPPQWWAVDLGTTSDVQEIAITAHASDNVGYLPLTFDLQYSDDGGTTWTTKRSFTTGTWATAQTKTFAIVSSTTWSTTDKGSITLTNGNLTAAASNNGFQAVRTVDRQVSGKWYFEYTFAVAAASSIACGFASAAVGLNSLGTTPGFTANAAIVGGGGQISSNNANTGALASFGAGGVVCFALDLDRKLFWARNGAAGNWNGSASANPVTAVGGFAFDFVGGGIPAYGVMSASNAIGAAITANFGDTAFTGAVPAGFTSGFTAGASIPTNEVATQAGVEEWGSSNPAMQATQVGVEHWGRSLNPGVVTQVSAEHWLATSPAAAVTQALVEHWGTVSTISTQAVVTQVAVEHWITEAAAPTTRRRRVVCVSG